MNRISSALRHLCFVLPQCAKNDDVIAKLNLHQSAFSVDFFYGDIQIYETSLQALVPFRPPPPPPNPKPKPESLLAGYTESQIQFVPAFRLT